MTDQEKFEKWYDNEYMDSLEAREKYRATAVNEIAKSAWQAAQADQAETIAQLQANLAKLRECLERYCGDKCNSEYNPCEARKTLDALSTTRQEAWVIWQAAIADYKASLVPLAHIDAEKRKVILEGNVFFKTPTIAVMNNIQLYALPKE